MGSMQEKKKVAIVTGATSGIGVDLARHLVSRGWNVACIGRNRERGESLTKSLDSSNARFFFADVADYNSQAAMFRRVWDTWGRIDALCANAGIVDRSSVYILDWRDKNVEDVPPPPDLSCTDTDYKGVVYGTQLATHYMRHNDVPGGKVIVTASIGAMFPHCSYPEYCGAKAAVVQFVRGASRILKKKDNISVNVVMPGIISTPIVPPEMIAAVTPECITPVETVLAAYDKFLDDDTLNGEAVECSASKLFFYGLPKRANGRITARAVQVWEPLFKQMHGESSELSDAIL